MDVRCERCRAQYVFDDDQVTPAGLTVQCTNCGHVFRVKKKELVVTVAVKPEELDGPPLPATAAAPRAAGAAPVLPPAHEGAREWRVRQASGNVLSFRELTTLQKWIIEQKVSADDEISLSGDGWRRLGGIGELASFFQVVEAAERGRRQSPPAAPSLAPAAALAPAPAPAPPPAVPRQAHSPAATPPPPPRARPAGAPPPAADEHSIEVELAPEDLAAVGRGPGRRVALALVPLLVVAGAAAYVFGARLLPARAPEPEAVAVPITIELAASPANPPAGGTAAGEAEAAVLAAAGEPGSAPVAPAPGDAQAAAPEPAPGPDVPLATPEPAAAPVVPPVPVPEPAPSAPEPLVAAETPPPAPAPKPPPAGPKALVAQAARLRERGEVEKALAIFGRVVEADPANVAALTGRGLCYLDLERYLPAEASFEAALRVRPDEADALLGLAESNRWQGKRANAIRYYERYLAAHPAGEEANVARNALEELRK